jgi:hypothetical protein
MGQLPLGRRRCRGRSPWPEGAWDRVAGLEPAACGLALQPEGLEQMTETSRSRSQRAIDAVGQAPPRPRRHEDAVVAIGGSGR